MNPAQGHLTDAYYRVGPHLGPEAPPRDALCGFHPSFINAWIGQFEAIKIVF
jgi:hypothetical protein